MSDRSHSPRADLPIVHLLPNLLTFAAICAGLTAIRFGFQGDFERAVYLILLACVLDGFDGRLARLLKAQSLIGAELDSLADFLNFGVAPALILYVWGLQDMSRAGWIAVLVYAICCVLRLARFNVSSKSGDDTVDTSYFVGVPSPAGAFLVMLPMFVSFLFPEMPSLPPLLIALYTVAVGLLMISHIPTYSFKNLAIMRDKAKFVVLGAVLLVAALLTYLWATLVFLNVLYILSILWALRASRKLKTKQG
ncbi:CDP-diacylglycerol--serine O-phosphatidyltransferase [Parasedimentitalea psychrophila]|uniref:CDP-diacylglycerol--serine O-phosphatidyltransferase n=1 Tax=Parasedimentitalea psychrophila TaxID=2997337 RepID=A0A9Y2L3Q9_9RHOB|nr:CDP-diacylglycerol--serine O-phosphatidyltransferase [Parasedimentitalea psychrophila]WIY26359.1 CDP-diacylglycerol--serine O-phosphatidyltransferase [Parasedimentitalea psychrophila]